MARLLSAIMLSAVAMVAQADMCVFNRTADVCPQEGATCTEKVLCASGLYCKVEELGQDGLSYRGRCSKGPAIEDVYNKPCDLGNDFRGCQFDNTLALNPYVVPNNLRCVKSPYTDKAGICLLGPQKHGDGCNHEGECASGNCLVELRICRGVDEGEQCAPGMPDPCMPNHYCAPAANSALGGRCQKAVTAGKSCSYPTACERGTYCAGDSSGNRKCVKMFSVATGQNTTIGPYMCQTGNALMIKPETTSTAALYQCVTSNSTLVGKECDSKKPSSIPTGYECKCSTDGKNRLRTIGALGLGARSQAWKDLYQCLLTATNPMGEPCEFDAVDMEKVRYGSCGFYACHPYYLKLVEQTGGRVYHEPLSQFEPTAPCEMTAVNSYYQDVMNTPCIRIPNLENWKCAKLLPPLSLSVQDTAGVISFIFILVIGGYCFHMYKFRRENKTKLPPCFKQ